MQPLPQLVSTLINLMTIPVVQSGLRRQEPICGAQGVERVSYASVRALWPSSVRRAVKESNAQLKLSAYELCLQALRICNCVFELVK